MVISSVADLVLELKKHPLLEPAQLDDVTRQAPSRFKEPRSLTLELLRRGWLTPFQVDLLLQGRGQQLAMGPFLLLDRIGEGGMGQIFKAHHQGLGRTVALKVLRPELVDDAEVVARFHREIKVASQLPPHPNLVRAYDAGQIGTAHFLAMEYEEGTDLERLVESKGPLPVDRACDYLRQAALGLQHAHEHSLVHRDIKPANLLVTLKPGPPGAGLGQIKVLDLGLARLLPNAKDGTRESTMLSADGTMTLGTVDYLSPEQALDFHKADIRADIYSLGCTAYYLLTGKPPFGNGPLAIKLMRHQQAEPPDLNKLRPDVPAALVPIIRRMLAKRPADRYQTPAAVAHALAALASPGQSARAASSPRKQLSLVGGASRSRLLVGVGGALLLAGLALCLFLFVSGPSPSKDREPSQKRSLAATTSPTLINSSVATETASGLREPISWVSTNKAYDVVTAKVGTVFYIDRPYTIIALSPALDGGKLIRAANGDKKVNSAEHLRFTLTGPADVYVAFDTRATGLPAWLNDGGWQRTNETFKTVDGEGALHRNVFRKQYVGGTVALGGNSQKPAASAGTHYVVIFQPANARP